MADLIAPNSNEPQEMAKQVESIAEAAAQHDEQVAQLLNLVPKAAALSTVASRAISFTKKNWVDTPTSGTPITAADMNRLEQAIVDLNTTLTSVQNSLSQCLDSDGVQDLGGGLTLFRLGRLCMASYSADGVIPNSYNRIGKTDHAPAFRVYGSAASTYGRIVVDTDGTIYFQPQETPSSSSSWRASVTWIASQ